MFALLGQLAIDGLTMGMVYVILAAGIVFIMSVSRIFYLAYGEFYMLGAYIAWVGVQTFHLPFLIALFLALLLTATLGILTYRIIFQYTTYSKGKFLATITAAMGLMLILGQASLIMFGTGIQSIPSLFRGVLSGFDVNITIDKLVLLVVTIVVVLLLFLFYGKTGIGLAMRTVSFNPEVSSLQGIDDKRICLISVGIGTALAGFAGAMIAPSYGIYPEMGRSVIVSVMLIAMLGGIDSLIGAVLGGIVVGLLLSFGQYFIGPYSQVLLFMVAAIIIFFKPGGLLGHGTELET